VAERPVALPPEPGGAPNGQNQSAGTDRHRNGCTKSECGLEGDAESELSLLRLGA
jgi:hypothetical protein